MSNIKKLKDLRLHLIDTAIRGKLVEQRVEDGTAQELFDKIQKEKQELIKVGKLKKEKALPEINEDEIPFEIPNSWVFVRFGEVANIVRGASPRPISKFLTTDKNGINWIKIGDAETGNKYITSTKEKISNDAINSTRLVKEGSFILSNSMSYGKPYILKIDGAIHDGWLAISDYEICFTKDFLYYLLSSPLLQTQFSNKVRGGIVSNLNSDIVKSVILVLPPLNEQKRIVEKLESHLNVIDRAIDLLERKDELNDALKQKVLQMAIQGKLVEQKGEDGTAQDLYDKIQKEKDELIKAGKLKKEKALPEISEDEIPFEIPDSWLFIRLNDIGFWGSGTTPSRNNRKYYDKGIIPWVKTGELKDCIIKDTDEKITDLAYKECSLKLYPPQSVLIAMYGATIGKLGILDTEATTNQACCCWRANNNINYKYLYYYLLANRENLIKMGAGGAQPNISKDKIIRLIFPLPPLNEQKRIVAKIEYLLARLDKR